MGDYSEKENEYGVDIIKGSENSESDIEHNEHGSANIGLELLANAKKISNVDEEEKDGNHNEIDIKLGDIDEVEDIKDVKEEGGFNNNSSEDSIEIEEGFKKIHSDLLQKNLILILIIIMVHWKIY